LRRNTQLDATLDIANRKAEFVTVLDLLRKVVVERLAKL
jgi:hypothetical protein